MNILRRKFVASLPFVGWLFGRPSQDEASQPQRATRLKGFLSARNTSPYFYGWKTISGGEVRYPLHPDFGILQWIRTEDELPSVENNSVIFLVIWRSGVHILDCRHNDLGPLKSLEFNGEKVVAWARLPRCPLQFEEMSDPGEAVVYCDFPTEPPPRWFDGSDLS